MAEEQNPDPVMMPEENASAQFQIQKLYTKDVSFETPNSPEIFTQQWQPEVNLNLNTASKSIADNTYETVLTLTTVQVAFLAQRLESRHASPELRLRLRHAVSSGRRHRTHCRRTRSTALWHLFFTERRNWRGADVRHLRTEIHRPSV